MGNTCRSDTRENDDKAAREKAEREAARLKKLKELKEHLENEGVLMPHNEEYICNQNVLLTKKTIENDNFPQVPNSKKKYLAEIIELIKQRMLSVPAIPAVDGEPASTEPNLRSKKQGSENRGFFSRMMGGPDEKKEDSAVPSSKSRHKIGDFCEKDIVIYEKAFSLVDLNEHFFFTQNELEDAVINGFFINRAEGYTYFGQFDENKKFHGKGRQIFEDGSVYEGWFMHGQKGPYGRFIFKDGDFFIGEFHQDKPHGIGYFNDMMEVEYKGEYVKGIRIGFGEEWNSSSLATYEGMFDKNKKNGYGIMVWEDGTKYEGHFLDNDFEGKGVYYWKDKRKYEGDWKRNMMHGEGLYTWKGDRFYKGGYDENKKSGYGEFNWGLGQKKYLGNWKNGLQDGEGELYSLEGELTKGTWKEGVLISIKSEGPTVNQIKNESEVVSFVPENEAAVKPTPQLGMNPSTKDKPILPNQPGTKASPVNLASSIPPTRKPADAKSTTDKPAAATSNPEKPAAANPVQKEQPAPMNAPKQSADKN